MCEQPNNAIYKFEGYIEAQAQKVSLGADNMILRGCKLRNTDWVIGVSVFTGHDSKIMMNSSAAKYKFSSLESLSNRAILLVLATQVFFALIGGGNGTDWIFDEAVKDSTGKTPAYYLEFGYISKYYTDKPDYKEPEGSGK